VPGRVAARLSTGREQIGEVTAPLPPRYGSAVEAGTPVLEIVGATLRAGNVRGVAAAWLFGSAAAGRMHEESDVDVAVLLDRRQHPAERDRFETRIASSTELGAALHDRIVDVVVLNDVSPLFARRVLRTGRLLLCTDPAAEHAFRRDVQLRAADLDPFVERVRRRAVEALAR
jgi:predicted nucleotidyltransferase